MYGAARSVHDTCPPSIEKSIRSTVTGELTSHATLPESEFERGDTNVNAAMFEHAEVLNETDGREDTLPAASRASTANVYELPHAKPETAYDVEVVCPNCDPSRYTV